MLGLPDIFHTAMCSVYQLVTLKDKTPEQIAAGERAAQCHRAPRTLCNRCGQAYEEPNATCINANIHDEVKR